MLLASLLFGTLGSMQPLHGQPLSASAPPAPESSPKKASAGPLGKGYASPQQAVRSLVEALQAGDDARLLTILGPDAQDLIHTDDPHEDQRRRRHFLRAYRLRSALVQRSDGSMVLHVGYESWPCPIPLVRVPVLRLNGAGAKTPRTQSPAVRARDLYNWRFDVAAGREEILNRRIGSNERHAVRVCEAYVEAQREYFRKDRDRDEVVEYATRLKSSPSRRDGLYYPVERGEERSPLGPLLAQAEAGAELGQGSPLCSSVGLPGSPTALPASSPSPGAHDPLPLMARPYHGYLFRVLCKQGEHAPGGAYDYMVHGHMVAGFALVAFPARYGETGIASFVVNQAGHVYQKDLGTTTRTQALSMQAYDPDASWQRL